ncbi:DUF6350 family protein [Salinispora tropica]|uniref:Integral membrane protein n=1 Tax=Salinispora tropica (strain ATCC BAA-916 / DSM 44818 / JCM 13857 / NBRC 105044 / CNB-440) TaxID=369723 RepID=A4XBE2_SALTO|nr:DUF6350 family protein [Salinispora tropica]ABP56241.1 hypothetical protein Strop_3810 [Salinispora tropica CNB-440]
MSSVTPDQPGRRARVGARPPGRPGPARRIPAPRAGGPPSRPPLAVAAGVAAVGAALTSWLPVAVVLWFFQLSEGASSLPDAVRVGLAGWLLGHGIPLTTSAGPLGLAPLAVTLLAGWRLNRAGVHVTRAIGARGSRSPRRAIVAAGAVGVVYTILGVLAALLVTGAELDVSPVRSGLTLAVVATVAALIGTVRTTGLGDLLAARASLPLREGVRTGLVAALLLLAAGAGAAGLAVATGGGDAADLIAAYRTGVAGQAGITLVNLAYAPNVAIWSASYLLGPGFAVGTDTTVQTSEVTVGALPALPLVAGLPGGPVDGLGTGLLAVPILVGMVAGWSLTRRLLLSGSDRAREEWGPLLRPAAFAGPVTGLLVGIAAAASAGPLGAGRLAEVGPVPWQVAAVATVVTGTGVLGGVVAARFLSRG